MIAVFFTLAALCVIYFLVIISYSGIATSFCGIWLFMALVFVAGGYVTIYEKKHKEEMPSPWPVFVYSTIGLGIAVLLFMSVLVVKESRKQYDGDLDYCIILGARVYPDGISRSLKLRLDRGLEYHIAHPDVTFVLSGGQGEGERLPEAMAMYNYMILNGIPDRQLIMELDSESTLENIAFSKSIIETDWENRREKSTVMLSQKPEVGLITSNYHLMRAVHIAETMGMEDVHSVAAKSDTLLYVHQCLRESAAILKDYLLGNFELNGKDLSIN